MSALAYSVIATLPDEPTASRYVRWLEGGHVDGVVEGGAKSAMIVRITDPADPIRVETRYIFANREVFETYERDHAPALRAEGLELFGPDSGVTFERRVGSVI